MNKSTIAKRGIGFGILNNIVSTILPFISRTIIIYILGTEYLGLGSLFTSIISILNITELGFGAAISNILYEPIAHEDSGKVRAILKFTKKSFNIIGLIILVVGILIIPFISSLISSDYPSNININYLYFIYLLNTVLSYFMYSYKRILFSAGQRYDIETNIGTISLLIQGVLQIIGLFLFKNYYVYSIVLILGTLVNNMMCGYYSKKLYPEYFCEGNISKIDLSVITKKVMGAFFSKIGSTIYYSADNIIISAFFGLTILGRYGNYYYVINTLVTLFAVVHNTLRPLIGHDAILKEKKEMYESYINLNNIYMLVVIICSSCLLCLYQDFISIWAGNRNLLSINIVILLTIYFFVGRLYAVASVYIESLGLYWESKYIPLLSGIINLLLNIFLSNIIGLPGVLISSILSSLIYFIGYNKILFGSYFAKKEYIKGYLKKTMIIIIQSIIIIILTHIIINKILVSSLIGLILKGILTVILTVFLILILNISEINKHHFEVLFTTIKNGGEKK